MDYVPASGLRYLFIDFNAFFAAAAQHDEPDLMGRPVVITPHESEYSGAIAASYEARPFGITRGTRIREARELCPDLVVRPARHDRYVGLHKQLMSAIGTVLPVDKVYSIDEAAFRLGRREREREAALAVAEEVTEIITKRVGPAFRSSIGLAQTRLLGKLAAGMNKPDGLTVLEASDLPGKLLGLPLSKIPGVGGGIEKRLAQNGVTDFQGLWDLAPKHARAIWHSVQGERFWYALHGYEVAEPPTKTMMFGHSRVLTSGYRSPDKARAVARALLLKAAARLRMAGLLATRLSLNMKRAPDGVSDVEVGFEASRDSTRFLDALNELWRHASENLDAKNQGMELSHVSVFLHGLMTPDDPRAVQGDLFACAGRAEERAEKGRLWEVIDQLNRDADGRLARLAAPPGKGAKRRMGSTLPRHVMLADQQAIDLDYLGTKIAFSRVPKEEEFLC
ncbi:type VI secretion protein ImpB [Parvularcula marina]|uniref:Y-family DNA polymerase n=1 Tax=Parvularcula marina TaxID=2292771 RepID=UPI003515E147